MSKFIEVNGINIAYKEAGQGKDMILIHGKGYSKENMNRLFNYYQSDYHVIAYDVRGHGESDKPEAFTLQDDSEDLKQLIEKLNLHKPIVIGFSMGSYITLNTAEKYPELFSKIVLIGTKGQGQASSTQQFQESAAQQGLSQQEAMQAMMRRIFAPQSTMEDIMAFNQEINSNVRLTDGQNKAIDNSLLNFDLLAKAENVTIPVLLLTGEYDGLNPPAEAMKVRDALPQATFYEIPDAGHIAFFENPERVYELIDNFIKEDITRMKNVIITGANSGLGYETAKKVAANHDYRVILACRNPQKAEEAKAQLIAETGNLYIDYKILDTSVLLSVREFADEIIEENLTVDVLVNNIGIPSMGNTGITDDGFDLVFQTNYLGHFYLTQLLMDSFAEDAHIYNITSDMHNPPGGMEWPGVEAQAHPQKEDRRMYSYTKLDLIYMTHLLAKQFEAEGSQRKINSFNPGFMSDTNFSKGGGKGRDLIVKTTMPDRYGKLSDSSDALAELITNPEYSQINGAYFDRSTETKQSSELSYNDDNAQELWDASIRYCGLDEE